MQFLGNRLKAGNILNLSMEKEKDKKEKKGKGKEECPLCKVSEESLEILRAKSREKKKAKNKKNDSSIQ